MSEQQKINTTEQPQTLDDVASLLTPEQISNIRSLSQEARDKFLNTIPKNTTSETDTGDLRVEYLDGLFDISPDSVPLPNNRDFGVPNPGIVSDTLNFPKDLKVLATKTENIPVKTRQNFYDIAIPLLAVATVAIGMSIHPAVKKDKGNVGESSEYLSENKDYAKAVEVTLKQLRESKKTSLWVHRAQGKDTIPKQFVIDVFEKVGMEFKDFSGKKYVFTPKIAIWMISISGQESGGDWMKKGGLIYNAKSTLYTKNNYPPMSERTDYISYVEMMKKLGKKNRLPRVIGEYACFGPIQTCDEERAGDTFIEAMTKLKGLGNIPSHQEFLDNKDFSIQVATMYYYEKLARARKYKALKNKSAAFQVSVAWGGMNSGNLNASERVILDTDYGLGVVSRKYGEAADANTNAVLQGRFLKISKN